MLHDPKRHETLQAEPWDEPRARATIAHIVGDTLARFSPVGWWPPHPRDLEPGDDPAQPPLSLYWGAAGVFWALDYLRGVGAVPGAPALDGRHLDHLLVRNRDALAARPGDERAAYLFGDTPILMMMQGHRPLEDRARRLAALIEANLDHPARELMWGSPGTLLAAAFLHRRFGDERFAALFRRTAARLRAQLLWSGEHGCHYWTQDLYGRRSTYIDGVHGFVATAAALIQGHALLADADWAEWQDIIANTVERTATREHGQANWRPWLEMPAGARVRYLMQYCHGAPGFVVCLAGFPRGRLDELLAEAGEAVWAAGPLAKGSNLCHGTGGNGYAFLVLHERTGDAQWLERARAFAMHGIAQTEREAGLHGRLRYSLWTGDLGFAVYLWDCIRAQAAFPTLHVFYPDDRDRAP